MFIQGRLTNGLVSPILLNAYDDMYSSKKKKPLRFTEASEYMVVLFAGAMMFLLTAYTVQRLTNINVALVFWVLGLMCLAGSLAAFSAAIVMLPGYLRFMFACKHLSDFLSTKDKPVKAGSDFRTHEELKKYALYRMNEMTLEAVTSIKDRHYDYLEKLKQLERVYKTFCMFQLHIDLPVKHVSDMISIVVDSGSLKMPRPDTVAG